MFSTLGYFNIPFTLLLFSSMYTKPRNTKRSMQRDENENSQRDLMNAYVFCHCSFTYISIDNTNILTAPTLNYLHLKMYFTVII